jgi:glycosyltransferase involved in cell wall biosynthesis
MKKLIKILYVGNNLTQNTGYNATIAVLSKLLRESYQVKVVSNKQNKFQRLLDMCFAVIKRRNETDFILIDTFSTSSFYFALIVSQMARLFGIKYIPVLRGGNLPYRLEHSAKMSNAIFNNSYANVAPSKYLKNAFQDKGFRTIFIPNILNISDYKFRERTQLKPNLLWVRAFDKTDNPVMAIEVLHRLKHNYPNAKLCMIGPFKDATYQEVLDRIKKYNLENSIEITGVLPKKEWVKKSEAFDIFINTTNFDNTPVSVMEAMALGFPIVSTNAGGLPFLIDDKNDGILIAKNDVKQMTEEIVNLLKKPLFANKLSVQARHKAESFDWQQVKNKWFELLK